MYEIYLDIVVLCYLYLTQPEVQVVLYGQEKGEEVVHTPVLVRDNQVRIRVVKHITILSIDH